MTAFLSLMALGLVSTALTCLILLWIYRTSCGLWGHIWHPTGRGYACFRCGKRSK